MNETTFRILDTLSREVGRPLSILELTRRIEHFHHTAYYANIYKKLQNLAAHGTIKLQKAGRSSIASLNFNDYFLLDLLTEMELMRKRRLLGNRPELQMFCADIDNRCKGLPFIQSISLVRPERNIRLNKGELLTLLQAQGLSEIYRLRDLISTFERAHSIRIDHLPLGASELLELISSDEANPLKEMLPDSVCVFSPQDFWSEILSAERRGIRISLDEGETDPRNLSESELVYNLARFGYREFGTEVKQSREIAKELLVTSLLLKSDARRTDAVAVILAKGSVRWRLLVFLAQKYGIGGKLLALLKALNHIKPASEIGEAIAALKFANVKEAKVNQKSIEGRLRLYNVIR